MYIYCLFICLFVCLFINLLINCISPLVLLISNELVALDYYLVSLSGSSVIGNGVLELMRLFL